MDTLYSMRIFRQVVEVGSFTKAADILGISTVMASKHVRHLESHVQARLLNRNSRSLSLTEAGRDYYLRCSQALDALEEARRAAQQGTGTPQGVLKITLPPWCATPYFARLLAEYRTQAPQVVLSLHLESRHSDLAALGMDLALRVTSRPEPDLIVKPLCRMDFFWVASPAYLERYGRPEADHWPQHHSLLPTYAELASPAPAAAESNNTLMLHQLALAGAGLACLPAWVIHDDVTAGRLQTLLPEPAHSHPLYACYLDRAYLSAKVRSFIDFLAQRLSAGEAA